MKEAERDISILKHILDYCCQIENTIARFGNDFEAFDNDQIYRNAVALCILQIGELVGILSENFKNTHASIPWVQIKKMRNIVAHRYGTVDSTITWSVMQEDIPALKEFCLAIMDYQT